MAFNSKEGGGGGGSVGDVVAGDVGGGVVNTPRQPWGKSPTEYFDLVKGRVLMPLGRWSAASRPQSDPQVLEKMKELEIFLRYVNDCRIAYPAAAPKDIFITKHRVKGSLILIFNPSYSSKQKYFSERVKSRANALYNWIDKVEDAGRIAVRQAALAEAQAKAQVEKTRSNELSGQIIPTPKNHPIWGRRGIMHGLARKSGDRFILALNPAYEDEKVAADKYGHNNLVVGKWFAYQLAALFKGAHGASNGGIYHNNNGMGAFSVVIAGTYEDLDNDSGEVILYSGSNVKDNDDPECPSERSKATNAMHDSACSNNPIRVIRKANKDSPWAPKVGFRYDGLYRVTDVILSTNSKGGQYEQFRLQRDNFQTPLEDLSNIPSIEQVNDYNRIKQMY